MGYLPVLLESKSHKMSGFNDDVAAAPFKEKKWFKDEDGEQITNGYSLRGRLAFKKNSRGFDISK